MNRNPHSENVPGHNKAYAIIVNARQRDFTGQRITYEEVVKLAFPDAPEAGDSVDFTVSYANPHGKDGTLVSGQDTKVHEGMVFNVTKTNRS